MKIEFNDPDVNVEDIINRMKSELSMHGIEENIDDMMLPLRVDHNNSESFSQLQSNLEIVNRLWNNPSEYVITSHRKFIGPVIVFAKKIMRKCLRWYINPIVYSQNEFNGSITRTINAMSTQLKLNEAVIEDMKKEISELKLSNQNLKKQINRTK